MISDQRVALVSSITTDNSSVDTSMTILADTLSKYPSFEYSSSIPSVALSNLLSWYVESNSFILYNQLRSYANQLHLLRYPFTVGIMSRYNEFSITINTCCHPLLQSHRDQIIKRTVDHITIALQSFSPLLPDNAVHYAGDNNFIIETSDKIHWLL